MLESIKIEQQGRGNIYRLLSALYYQPSIEMKPLLVNLKEWVELIFPVAVADVILMQEYLEGQEEDITKLLVDYARLFVGPFSVIAPPYGSVYLEKERKVMGDTTLAVRGFYQEAGLELGADQRDLPDHIAIELEFLYYLLFQGYDELYKRFLQEHLGNWVRNFGEVVEMNAKTEFYRCLARITYNFVEYAMQLPLDSSEVDFSPCTAIQ